MRAFVGPSIKPATGNMAFSCARVRTRTTCAHMHTTSLLAPARFQREIGTTLRNANAWAGALALGRERWRCERLACLGHGPHVWIRLSLCLSAGHPAVLKIGSGRRRADKERMTLSGRCRIVRREGEPRCTWDPMTRNLASAARFPDEEIVACHASQIFRPAPFRKSMPHMPSNCKLRIKPMLVRR